MAKGISLHIGVNSCDPSHYSGWSGPLDGCEADADELIAIARSQGYDSTLLKTADATRDAVTGCIRAAAQDCDAGDIFLISYAGHGGQINDVDGDEEDMIDETWCLYDGQLLDDELNILWAQFKPGVRVLVISDSCHSGSVTKAGEFRQKAMGQRNNLFAQSSAAPKGTFRFMPRDAARNAARQNKGFYTRLQMDLPRPRPTIEASVRLLSGCQDDQLSSEVDGNGVFTRRLVSVWNEGKFADGYPAFHKEIIAGMAESQQPNHLVVGQALTDYDEQAPFTID